MTESDHHFEFDDPFPSLVRRTVSKQNQFHLPAALVPAVGFQSARGEIANGAKVAWYYHEVHDKAVLANDSVDRSSLELVGVCRLTGVSNTALATGDVTGGRVTIISALPESVYERLTRGDIVLKPLYAGRHSGLDASCVSVYPAQEYDQGTLPNVDRDLREVECEDGSVQVQSTHSHSNSF